MDGLEDDVPYSAFIRGFIKPVNTVEIVWPYYLVGVQVPAPIADVGNFMRFA